MYKVKAMYIDGSSVLHVNSGYGIVVLYTDGSIDTLSGKVPSEGRHTNQRAELTALIKAIEILEDIKYEVEIYSDSMYAINSATTWLKGWKNNSWINSKGKTIENLDLIKIISSRISRCNIKLIHVMGHKGNKYNEMADKLAKAAARSK